MKFIAKILIVVILFFGSFLAQEKSRDSLRVETPYVHNSSIYETEIPSFELYRTLYFSNENIPLNTDSSTMWLWTSMVLSNRVNNQYLSNEKAPHMLANFHDFYVEGSKFNIIKTVLGAAQLGAVGYLAYKSIKKHGFWDNK